MCIRDSFRVAALLAVVGGFLDAYTYILRGGVFANAQTGNIVLLGVHMADKDYRQALYYVAVSYTHLSTVHFFYKTSGMEAATMLVDLLESESTVCKDCLLYTSKIDIS